MSTCLACDLISAAMCLSGALSFVQRENWTGKTDKVTTRHTICLSLQTNQAAASSRALSIADQLANGLGLPFVHWEFDPLRSVSFS